MIYLGDQAVGIAVKWPISMDYLQTLTFINALGQDGRQTIIPQASWDKYNALLIIPHISIDPQPNSDGTQDFTTNWFWYEISDGTNINSSYDGDGAQGLRCESYSMLLIHDKNDHQWRFGCYKGSRHAIITSDAPLTDITIKVGTLYGNTHCYMNGTMDVYGLYYKTNEEVTPNG